MCQVRVRPALPAFPPSWLPALPALLHSCTSSLLHSCHSLGRGCRFPLVCWEGRETGRCTLLPRAAAPPAQGRLACAYAVGLHAGRVLACTVCTQSARAACKGCITRLGAGARPALPGSCGPWPPPSIRPCASAGMVMAPAPRHLCVCVCGAHSSQPTKRCASPGSACPAQCVRTPSSCSPVGPPVQHWSFPPNQGTLPWPPCSSSPLLACASTRPCTPTSAHPGAAPRGYRLARRARAGPSAAEVGALVRALAPLRGHLRELQLHRTSLGPKSLQALCSSVAQALGQSLEVRVQPLLLRVCLRACMRVCNWIRLTV